MSYLPVWEPGSCLLFWKVGSDVGSGMSAKAERLVKSIPGLFEGAREPPPGDIVILTSVELVNLPGIRWRMSRWRMEKMVKEKWAMVGYRTDMQRPCEFRRICLWLCVADSGYCDALCASVSMPVLSNTWKEAL